MNEHLRGTGRTTRMLHHIITKVLECNSDIICYVVGWNEGRVVMLMEWVVKALNHTEVPYKCNHHDNTIILDVTSSSILISRKRIQFHTPESLWRNGITQGDPEKIFYDHLTLEMQYAKIWEEMHRWDLPKDQTR